MNLKVPNCSVHFFLKLLPSRVHSKLTTKYLSMFYSHIFQDLFNASENCFLTIYQTVQDSALVCSKVYQMYIYLVGFRNLNAGENFYCAKLDAKCL